MTTRPHSGVGSLWHYTRPSGRCAPSSRNLLSKISENIPRRTHDTQTEVNRQVMGRGYNDPRKAPYLASPGGVRRVRPAAPLYRVCVQGLASCSFQIASKPAIPPRTRDGPPYPSFHRPRTCQEWWKDSADRYGRYGHRSVVDHQRGAGQRVLLPRRLRVCMGADHHIHIQAVSLCRRDPGVHRAHPWRKTDEERLWRRFWSGSSGFELSVGFSRASSSISRRSMNYCMMPCHRYSG